MKAKERTQRSPTLTRIVRKMFNEHYTLLHIAHTQGCSVGLISRIIQDDIMAKRSLGFSVIDTDIDFDGRTRSYYETEEDIIQALDPLFETSDLTGWELQQFNQNHNVL
jgi:hypothetical protein